MPADKVTQLRLVRRAREAIFFHMRVLAMILAFQCLTQLRAAEPTGASAAYGSKDALVVRARVMMDAGNFKQAEQLLAANPGTAPEPTQARSELAEIISRTRHEYSLDTNALLDKVRQSIPDVTYAEIERWAAEANSRFRVIDGTKFFFRREPRNIFLFSKEAIARATKAGKPPKPESKTALLDHLAAVIAEAERTGATEVLPVRHTITHSITIRSNHPALKPGAVVRAWLPFPQEYRQQRDVKLISVSPAPKQIAPNGIDGNPVGGGAQRTVYFEQVITNTAQPVVFREVVEFTAYAYYPKLDAARVQPLPKDWNAECLGERPPHIVFTPEIKQEATRIVGTETNALAKARKIFRWVSDNIPWCAEDEYCLIPSFSIKGFSARQGDCGVQNTVFITMCRIAGIPARWQSGYETKPGDDWGMHDWAEIYIAPWGWLPADASYGVRDSNDPRVAEFYLGHQDSYRWIVNLDWGRELFPPKKSFRSEPADFQRGEVEVDGKNLFFNEWDAKTEVVRTPLNKLE
jgi:transglutaminase-like putative cysteine protease